MNRDTCERPDKVARDLIRRGLPIDYARRTAAELDDHRHDLVEELRGAGLSELEAAAMARQRLGETTALVRRAVRAYRRRFWCGRWPLVTFLLAPIPALIAAWAALAYGLWFAVNILVQWGMMIPGDVDTALTTLPVQVKFMCLAAMFLVIPGIVMYGFARLAKRAALGWPWVLVVARMLGLFMGAWKWERVGPGSRLVMRDRQTLEEIKYPPQHDFVLVFWMPLKARAWSWHELRGHFFSTPVLACQLLLPIAVAALFLVRRKQLALRDERLAIDGC